MAEKSGIARPYAEAAFELARDSGSMAGWSDLLRVAAQTVNDQAVSRLIHAPGTRHAALVDFLAGICHDASPGNDTDLGQVTNLLRLLAENGRLPVLPEISDLFDKQKAEAENTVEVVLTAASPVDPAQQEKISSALKQRFGRDVNLRFQLDENLIGGARLQADDLIIDGSIRTGLEKLSSALTN